MSSPSSRETIAFPAHASCSKGIHPIPPPRPSMPQAVEEANGFHLPTNQPHTMPILPHPPSRPPIYLRNHETPFQPHDLAPAASAVPDLPSGSLQEKRQVASGAVVLQEDRSAPPRSNHSAGSNQGGKRDTRGKAKGRKAGTQNYSHEDIDTLLDQAAEILPLDAHHWALVGQRFAAWAGEEGRPERDIDALKAKFDKLSNTKKPTGSPTCLPSVRRAKHIARDILAK